MSKKQELIKLTVMTRDAVTGRYVVPKEIEGKRVTLPGYEAFTFILHRQIGRANKWTVTEASTGFKVLSDNRGGNSQREALENWRATFEGCNMTPAKLQKHIDIQLRHFKKHNGGNNMKKETARAAQAAENGTLLSYKTIGGAAGAAAAGDTVLQIMGDTRALYVIAPAAQRVTVSAFTIDDGATWRTTPAPVPVHGTFTPHTLEAIRACLPDLKHYAATHGPGPDRRLDALQAVLSGQTQRTATADALQRIIDLIDEGDATLDEVRRMAANALQGVK